MWNEAVSIHNQSKLPMKRVASIFPANKRAFLYPFHPDQLPLPGNNDTFRW